MGSADNEERAIGMLPALGFIRASGVDATGFLQSMLSADIEALEVEASTLSGWHDRTGRALACPRVVRKPNEYWLVLPHELVADVLSGLGRYVLRSRVALSDASAELAAAGVITAAGRYEIYAAQEPLEARVADHLERGARALGETEWELGAIRDGLPAVYASTQGLFTAQMLNLDLVGGVSFTKGCYPGQEIIARTHHLGRAKRRMLRFLAAAPPEAPGAALRDDAGRRAGQVVRAAASAAGSEALVVTTPGADQLLRSEAGVVFERAPLPYAIA